MKNSNKNATTGTAQKTFATAQQRATYETILTGTDEDRKIIFAATLAAQREAEQTKKATIASIRAALKQNKQYTKWNNDAAVDDLISECMRATMHEIRYLLGKSGNPRLLPLFWGGGAVEKQLPRFIDDNKKGVFEATRGIIQKGIRDKIVMDGANNIIIPDIAGDFMDCFHTAIAEYLDAIEKELEKPFNRACAAVRSEIYLHGDRGRKQVKIITDKIIKTTVINPDGTTREIIEKLPEFKQVARWAHVALENINENDGTPEPIVTYKGENDTRYRTPEYIAPEQLPENIELLQAQQNAIETLKTGLTDTQRKIFLAIQELTKTRKGAREMSNKQIAIVAKLVKKDAPERDVLNAAEKVRATREILKNKARAKYPQAKTELFAIVA